MTKQIEPNRIYAGDSSELMRQIPTERIHLILSDIPYGIGIDDWDVIHRNTNSAYLGSSPAQKKAGKVFHKRGKPLNGWSESDRLIPKQYYEWVSSWAHDWFRALKPGGNAFVFAGRRMAHRCICAFEDIGFTLKDILAWEKDSAPHRAQRISVVYQRRNDEDAARNWWGWRIGNLRPIFEPILWFSKPYRIGGTIADNVLLHHVGAFNEEVLKKYGQPPNNLWHFPYRKADTGLHPTQKPIKLMELLIELTTQEGQIVLDPYCGSGTTLVAASRLNRNYIGFEKELQYVQVATKRIEQETQNTNSILFT